MATLPLLEGEEVWEHQDLHPQGLKVQEPQALDHLLLHHTPLDLHPQGQEVQEPLDQGEAPRIARVE